MPQSKQDTKKEEQAKKTEQPKKEGKLKCGLIMPIAAIGDYSEKHWVNVRMIIDEALNDSSFQANLVSNADDVGVIQRRIVQNIYDNDMIICDVSAKNPNVMFELGMRLAFDKPAIIIKDDQTSYSFDTAPIEHLAYPRDLNYHAIIAFKKLLLEKVEKTYEASQKPGYTTFLKHFGEFKISGLEKKNISREDFVLKRLEEISTEIVNIKRLSPGWIVRANKDNFNFDEYIYPIMKRYVDNSLKKSHMNINVMEAVGCHEYIKDVCYPFLTDLGLSQERVSRFVKNYIEENKMGFEEE